MKEKVVIYGLGSLYEAYKDRITSDYEVVGLCDKNEAKIPGVNGVRLEALCLIIDQIDYVLLTVGIGKVSQVKLELMDCYGVPEGKIKTFQRSYYDEKVWGRIPYIGHSWSENFEDILIANIFIERGLDLARIRYIDLGACSPKSGNNTYYFYERGATGILVEANPDLIDQLHEERPKDVVLNCAVYNDADTVEFYISSNAGLSSLDKNHVNKNDSWSKDWPVVKTINIEARSINDIFKELGTECNLLSIDLEGYDEEALLGLDFSRYHPNVIVAELLYQTSEQHMKYKGVVDLILKNGYTLYANNVSNGIFCDSRWLERR